MKSRNSYVVGVSLILCQPLLRADHSDGVLAGAIAAAFAAGGAVVGGLVHWSQTSKSHQQQEAEKEKKKVAEARASLERMKTQRHRILKEPQNLNYQGVAALDAGRDLHDLKDQLQDFAGTIQEQKEQLSSVTGKYREKAGDKDLKADEDYYAQAKGLWDEYVVFERDIVQCQGLLHRLEVQRDAPLRTVERVKSFVHNAQVHAHSDQQFLNFITNTYNGSVTTDEIKGLPLVCAVEDISAQLIQIDPCRNKLMAHQQSLQSVDPTTYSALGQLNAWHNFLNKVTQIIAGTKAYREQVENNKISKIARLNAQAEHERERRERALAERALVETKNRERELENRRAELELANKQATTNAINSATNAANTAIDLSNAREKLREEKQARKQAEDRLRDVEHELRIVRREKSALEQQILAYSQRDAERQREQEEAQEGYCRVHKCLSERCPDLSCRY